MITVVKSVKVIQNDTKAWPDLFNESKYNFHGYFIILIIPMQTLVN